MNAVYDNFAKFYNLEYGHKDNDLEFYIDLAKEHGDPVLEIGVGTGRVAFELAAAGHRVHGIDNSAAMLELAQTILRAKDTELKRRVTFSQADMRRFDLDDKFPLCIAPFRALLHNLTFDDQISTLGCIKRRLKPGGVFAFDLFVPLYNLMAQETWHDRIEADELADPNSGMTIEIEINHDPKNQTLNIRNTYFHRQGKTEFAEMKYRYIFKYEMEALLRLAGFTRVTVYGGFEKQPYDYTSGIMVFVAGIDNE